MRFFSCSPFFFAGLFFVVAACDDGGAHITPTDMGTETTDLFETLDLLDADLETDAQADVPDGDEPIEGNWLVGMSLTQTTANSPTGADLSPALPSGAVRAGIVTDLAQRAEFGPYPGRCRVNDYKMVNERAAFCIEGLTSVMHMLYDGGHLIDAVALGGVHTQDQLLFHGVNLELRETEVSQVEVVRDGSDGGDAVIRTTGKDAPLRFLAGVLGSNILSFPASNHTVVTEYTLAAGSRTLEITTFISHERTSYLRTAGDYLSAGDLMQVFVPGVGFDAMQTAGSQHITVSPLGSYLLSLPFEGQILAFAESADATPVFTAFDYMDGRIPPNEVAAYTRLFVVGEGSSFDLEAELARYKGEADSRVEVQVEVTELGSAEPIPDLLLQVFDAQDVPVGVAFTEPDGIATFAIEPGEYHIVPGEWDGPLGSEVSLSVGAGGLVAPAVLQLPTAARLTVEVDDVGLNAAMPARIKLQGPVHRLFHSASGRDTLLLPPGDYQVEVSRGLEYDVLQTSVSLTNSLTPTVVTAGLNRVMPTPGFVAGEFHQHATPSLDSTVPVVDRVLENLADGVDFMGPSDHDQAFDYSDIVEQLGVREQLFALNGVEVSPSWGHFNGVGVLPDPTKTSYGSPLLSQRDAEGKYEPITASQIIELLVRDLSAKLVQINHPRSGSGFFESIKLDPDGNLDEVSESKFPRGFSTMELYNGSADVCKVARDWYMLLNNGYQMIVVGNSDTHGLGGPAGFPRNYVRLAEDTPAQLNRDLLGAAVLSGDVTIAGGALIQVGGDWKIGETRAVSAGTPISIPVQVLSPPYSRTTTLLVVVNGHIVETLTFAPLSEDIIDFDGTVEVTLTKDSYVHFVVWGTDGMTAVYTGRPPFSITNPIFFDVDGDADNDGSSYEAPRGETVPVVNYAICGG